MSCLFLCCCISPPVLSKPVSLQRPAPCRRTRLVLPHWQAVQMAESDYLTFLPNRKNINHKKTMSSFPIPRAVLLAGNGAEWINVLLKLMRDDKGVAVLTAEPEGCKVREIPPSWCIPLIQNKPCYASGSSTFTITIKHFSLHFSYLCVLSSTNYFSEALR